MPTNVKQMIEVANAAVPRITPAQAKEMMAKGKTLVVDVRDASHLHAALHQLSRCETFAAPQPDSRVFNPAPAPASLDGATALG